MDNNQNLEFRYPPDIPGAPAPEAFAPPPPPDPILVEKAVKAKLRGVYNSAPITLLLQLGIASAISGMLTMVYTFLVTLQTMSESSTLDPELLLETVLNSALSPTFLLLTTAISYLIANVVSYFVGNSIRKKNYDARLFGKIQLKPLDCILTVFSVLGIQMVSVLIQLIIMSITNMSGIDETTAGMLNISDNVFQNIILILYTVIIAAISEELLLRGVVMKAFSAKSKTFALIASSLLFGIMHGNFNQMFNGFLLGIVIGYAALKSRSIILPIILHMCANGHAMLLSFLEYKLSDKVMPFETVYIIALAVMGIAAMVWLFIRNGRINDEKDGYPVKYSINGLSELENQKGLTWALLLKSPIFWIFTVIYLFTALTSLTALA